MIEYNNTYFSNGIDRHGTDCEKWDIAERNYGQGLLPLWVADMDFPSAEGISKELVKRALHKSYGYTEIGENDYEEFINFMGRRHDLNVDTVDCTMMSCVVTSLKTCIRCFTNIGDKIVIQTPVYGPFTSSITINNRNVCENKLIADINNKYFMDFEHLEFLFKNDVKLMFICNPHNPVSRFWREEELKELLTLAKKYKVIVVSDEIHADFVYKPNKFISMLKIAEGIDYDNVICLFSASKTFNVAGLQQSQLVTKNKVLMEKIKNEVSAAGLTHGNIFGLVATKEAYRSGRLWLDALLKYLDESRNLLVDTINKEIPDIIISPIEATYLAWLDVRAYGLSTKTIMDRTIENKVLFTPGTFFSEKSGEGFIRFNFACPQNNIIEGIKRLKKALK